MTFDGRLFSGITVLAVVAESASFVRAADALGLSPSGVSRAVSRLATLAVWSHEAITPGTFARCWWRLA
jgi:hypothetical protein